ncbi:cytochrome P450 [Mycena sanguinolenta]|nr:cytochrome P450 [Mycena sanguinolenta]
MGSQLRIVNPPFPDPGVFAFPPQPPQQVQVPTKTRDTASERYSRKAPTLGPESRTAKRRGDSATRSGTPRLRHNIQTAAIMQWFSALIPAHPDIQKKSHEELDREVGRNRLPTVEDEKVLSFEGFPRTLKLNVLARTFLTVTLLSRRAYQSTFGLILALKCQMVVYGLIRPCHVNAKFPTFLTRNAFIPKGTVVVLNTWTMHHDSLRHSKPETLNPDRYMRDGLSSAESANLPDLYQRDHWMFGAGRRICPAMIVAEREIWLTIARMLWVFKMEALPNEPIDFQEYDVSQVLGMQSTPVEGSPVK